MRPLRAELARLVDALVAGSAEGQPIELDAIGEAIGARAVTQDEIDAIFETLEQRGRPVANPRGGRGEADLKIVVAAARALRAELGRAPRPVEIAERTGLSRAEVDHALALARIIQR